MKYQFEVLRRAFVSLLCLTAMAAFAATDDKTKVDAEDAEWTGEVLMTFVMVERGDANADGKVNATDIVEVVNYLQGEPSEIFVEDAADVDGSLQVDADDVLGIAKIILSVE